MMSCVDSDVCSVHHSVGSCSGSPKSCCTSYLPSVAGTWPRYSEGVYWRLISECLNLHLSSSQSCTCAQQTKQCIQKWFKHITQVVTPKRPTQTSFERSKTVKYISNEEWEGNSSHEGHFHEK